MPQNGKSERRRGGQGGYVVERISYRRCPCEIYEDSRWKSINRYPEVTQASLPVTIVRDDLGRAQRGISRLAFDVL